MLKILHTSDLHLGKSLCSLPRREEFAAVLAHLTAVIEEQSIDVLLLAGDIFDTALPSNETQTIYYDFLASLAKSSLSHTVIIAGNHDSPAFLRGPHELLSRFNIHVIANIDPERPEQEVLLLKDKNGAPQLIVSASPYIREREIRGFFSEENEAQRHSAYREAVMEHLKKTAACAFALKEELLSQGHQVPVIAMAHLFTAGGITYDDDGVKELFVGSLSHIDPKAFDARYDYVALGHLHEPQLVGKEERIQYSGTPLAMGFGEREHKHAVLVIFDNGQRMISYIDFPVSRRLKQLAGDLEALKAGLAALSEEGFPYYVEILLEGTADEASVRRLCEEYEADGLIKVVLIKDHRRQSLGLRQEDSAGAALASLSEESVFLKLLEKKEIPEEAKPELLETYRALRRQLAEEENSCAS